MKVTASSYDRRRVIDYDDESYGSQVLRPAASVETWPSLFDRGQSLGDDWYDIDHETADPQWLRYGLTTEAIHTAAATHQEMWTSKGLVAPDLVLPDGRLWSDSMDAADIGCQCYGDLSWWRHWLHHAVGHVLPWSHVLDAIVSRDDLVDALQIATSSPGSTRWPHPAMVMPWRQTKGPILEVTDRVYLQPAVVSLNVGFSTAYYRRSTLYTPRQLFGDVAISIEGVDETLDLDIDQAAESIELPDGYPSNAVLPPIGPDETAHVVGSSQARWIVRYSRPILELTIMRNAHWVRHIF